MMHIDVIGMVLLKYKNLLSLDSVYWFYRGLGEPLSTRKQLTNIFVTSKDRVQDHQNYTKEFIHGKICLHFTSSLLIYFHFYF